MRRLLALCLFGLACTAAGCTLDFGNTDQGAGGDDIDDPGDLPGDEYRACVLATLQECDDNELPPNACTDLIAANCNTSECDPDTDPTGMCPPPDDCYATVFEQCIAEGGDPDLCAMRADLECNPGCTPMDPGCECDPTLPPDICDPYPPPPDTCWQDVFEACLMEGIDPNECAERAELACNPIPPDCWSSVFEECIATGQAPDVCQQLADESCPVEPPPTCDWNEVFLECLNAGIDPMECQLRADEACPPYPPGCDDPTNPMCCDPATGECPPPPGCDDPAGCPPPPPADCWTIEFTECVNAGFDPMSCAQHADEQCSPDEPPPPPTCEDPTDPGCEPWPPVCEDPMDPACWECLPDGTCYPALPV